MTVVEGIDVANWQGAIDWPAAAADGVGFAWAKATEGVTFLDPYFAINQRGAQAAGVPFGGYHFARPSKSSPELEAQHFRMFAGTLELPAALDAEAYWLPSRQANTDWVLRWLDSIGEPHRLLYTNGDGVLNRLDSNRLAANGVDLWYAHPGAPAFGGAGAFAEAAVVQYGARAVAGIAGNVDADRMLDTTLARYSGQPTGDDDMPAAKIIQLGDDELVVLPGAGARPWTAPIADANLVAVFVFGVFDPVHPPFPNPIPRIDDPAQKAAIRAWCAAGGHGDGPEHLVGTVDIHST